MTVEEIFNKLDQDRGMKWTDVMSGLVAWAADKYGDDVESETILQVHPTFGSILDAYYSALLSEPESLSSEQVSLPEPVVESPTEPPVTSGSSEEILNKECPEIQS